MKPSPGVNLGLAAAVVFGLLAVLNQLTQPRIEANIDAQAQAIMQALSADLNPESLRWQSLEWPDLPGQPEALGLRDSRPVTLLWQAQSVQAILIPSTSQRGYSGDIDILVALTPEGDRLGVGLVQHRETPGIGDRIQPNRTDWLEQLSGPSEHLAHPPLGNIDRLSGATITTTAVLAAVNAAQDWFAEHAEVLIGEEQAP